MKPDGSMRPCGDYRRLNAQTTPDKYGIPNIGDMNIGLHGKKIFSTLDLERAYFQIPIAEDSIPKTAIITPFGLYEFTRMCFGLRNAAQTFQRFIDSIFRDLPYVFAYIDDVLIASTSEEEHKQHLREVFTRLKTHGLTIKVKKCVFGQPNVTFLGYDVNQDGVAPVQTKVDALNNYPKPETIKDLRRFLAMVNFYRRCLPHAAEVQRPLNAYMKGSKKNDKRPVDWTPESSAAFEKTKEALRDAIRLGHPAHETELTLDCDASAVGIGAVLQQRDKDSWVPLGFYSKALSPSQQKYGTYDRELLAMYQAVRHFRQLLEGRNFTIRTDHKPLTFAFDSTSDDASPIRTRYLSYIAQFTTDIQYIKGEDNPVADALSRLDELDTFTQWEDLAAAQQAEEENGTLPSGPSFTLKKTCIPGSLTSILCETTTSTPRPYLPEAFRRAAFERVHGPSHPGVRSSRKMVARRYFWPRMNIDVGKWAKTCAACQKAKVTRHTISPLGSFPFAARFEHLHLDIVGPLPPSDGMQYCVTMIDRFTRWPEVIPVPDIQAETVARAFVDHWISRFGTPLRLTTDQGRQFESHLFRQLSALLGIDRIRTTPYHPQANGQIERFHRTLKAALMAREAGHHWTRHLPIVLLGLRSTLNEENHSPAQMVFGTTLRLPGDFFLPSDDSGDGETFVRNLQEAMANLGPNTPRQTKEKTFVPKDLATCSHVFVKVQGLKRSLTPPYEGPYEVISRTDKTIRIQLGGRESTVSLDLVKPALLSRNSATRDNTSPARTESPDTTPRTSELPTTDPASFVTRSGRTVKKTVQFDI